jgi:hypothetical protein
LLAILPLPDQIGGIAAWRPMLPNRDLSFATTVPLPYAID